MSMDDLRREWQAHDHGAPVQPDADKLLTQVRREQQAFEAMILTRDVLEGSIAVLLSVSILLVAMKRGEWLLYLGSAACFGVGAFLFVDRWIQRVRRPRSDDSLRSCLQESLAQVRHQIVLLKNIFWWYLLPLGIGAATLIGTADGQIRHRDETSGLAFGIVLFAFLATFTGIYWLNQRAVARQLEPRRKELEALLSRLQH